MGSWGCRCQHWDGTGWDGKALGQKGRFDPLLLLRNRVRKQFWRVTQCPVSKAWVHAWCQAACYPVLTIWETVPIPSSSFLWKTGYMLKVSSDYSVFLIGYNTYFLFINNVLPGRGIFSLFSMSISFKRELGEEGLLSKARPICFTAQHNSVTHIITERGWNCFHPLQETIQVIYDEEPWQDAALIPGLAFIPTEDVVYLRTWLWNTSVGCMLAVLILSTSFIKNTPKAPLPHDVNLWVGSCHHPFSTQPCKVWRSMQPQPRGQGDKAWAAPAVSPAPRHLHRAGTVSAVCCHGAQHGLLPTRVTRCIWKLVFQCLFIGGGSCRWLLWVVSLCWSCAAGDPSAPLSHCLPLVSAGLLRLFLNNRY